MVSYNLGSTATDILTEYPSISTAVSGALLKIVDRQRLFMEERTGLSIGSVGIAEKYQPALFALSAAAALRANRVSANTIGIMEIGDFSMEQTDKDSTNTASLALHAEGMEMLKRLGTTARFRRVIG